MAKKNLPNQLLMLLLAPLVVTYFVVTLVSLLLVELVLRAQRFLARRLSRRA